MWYLPRSSRVRAQSRAAIESVLLGFVAPPVASSGPDLFFRPPWCDRPTVRRKRPHPAALLITTSGSLLKQPDNQKRASFECPGANALLGYRLLAGVPLPCQLQFADVPPIDAGQR